MRKRLYTDQERKDRAAVKLKRRYEKNTKPLIAARRAVVDEVYTSVVRRDTKFKYHQRMPRVGGKKVQRQASLDISQDCRENDDYTKNYICQEYRVWQYLRDYPYEFVNIDNLI